MNKINPNSPLNERFGHLLKLMSSELFLNTESIGNEVPFYICPFEVAETNDIYNLTDKLIVQLKQRQIHVLNINLYHLIIELLKANDIFDDVVGNEKQMPKDLFLEALTGPLDIESHLVPAIKTKLESGVFDIMFITGVGEVFPYIRSHILLNNLQSAAKDKPSVLFFPGDYDIRTGSTLKLFGKIRDNYYRAFNIFEQSG